MRTAVVIGSACLLVMIGACGVKPPTDDLNMAKAALAKAEEAQAAQFAAEEYGRAKAELREGEGLMVQKRDQRNKKARQKLVSSRQASEEAYRKSAPAYADFNIAEAERMREEARTVRAHVAVRDRFGEAERLLEEARGDRQAGRFESSWDKSIRARAIFQEATDETRRRRARAEEALREAGEAIQSAKERQGE